MFIDNQAALSYSSDLGLLLTFPVRKCVFILARIWDPRLLEEWGPKCAGNVESSSCYRKRFLVKLFGTIKGWLFKGPVKRKWCKKCSHLNMQAKEKHLLLFAAFRNPPLVMSQRAGLFQLQTNDPFQLTVKVVLPDSEDTLHPSVVISII